ncbi:hypothetical protein [Xanthobacter wiegelii]|uniref:hypothetical protein n=1 Tax=Xanthobacter wiegelii TaxID=3119913 RepID=UPI00372970D8
MTLSDVLTITIALVLTYTMMSLLVSTVQEQVAAIFKNRQKGLEAAIRELVAPDGTTNGQLRQIAEELYGHALVGGTSPKGRPSYVPARNFTLALLSLVSQGSQADTMVDIRRTVGALPDGKLKQALATLMESAGADLDSFRAAVDGWYDQAMDRLNGQYKRHTQAWLVAIGFLLAAALNVDTFTLVDALMKSPQLRAELQLKAEVFSKQGLPPDGDISVSRILSDLAPLPIGWHFCPSGAQQTGAEAAKPSISATPPTGSTRCVSPERLVRAELRWTDALNVAGWLLTAIAISFGAPFWFQLLNQLVNLRAAGPPPEVKPEAKPDAKGGRAGS